MRKLSLLSLLALAAYITGDRLHLLLEHHHLCPVTGEPVHHERPDTDCQNEEGTPHRPHPAGDHLQTAAMQAVAKQVHVDACLTPRFEFTTAPALVRAVSVFRMDPALDPPGIRLRPSRAPPPA